MMPNYYLTVERSEHMEEPWSTPPTYGFASQENAQKLRPGDMVVDFAVADVSDESKERG